VAAIALALAAATIPLVAIGRVGVHPGPAHAQAAGHVQAATGAGRSFNTAMDAAVAEVKAKTGLAYTGEAGCSGVPGCLTQPTEIDGRSAAYVKFLTADSGVTACLGYVVQGANGAWHPFGVACGRADALTPARGLDAIVVPQAGCVNVRDAAGLSGPILNCLAGTAVTIDDGPTYADHRLWWHLQDQGWMAHEFLKPA
jgi:hypothetical protein